MKLVLKILDKKIDLGDHNIFIDFIKFLQLNFPLEKKITIVLTDVRKGKMTTGYHNHKVLMILTKDRILRDILRTTAHEWIHELQDENFEIEKIPLIQREDQANAISGRIINQFESQNPELEPKLYNKF